MKSGVLRWYDGKINNGILEGDSGGVLVLTGVKIAKIAILNNLATLIILKLKKRLCRKY